MKTSVIFFMIFMTGCSASKHKLEKDKPYWVEYDSTRRGAMIFYDGQNSTYCAEPPPDTARSRSVDALAKIDNKTSASIDAELKYQTAILQLTKRTESMDFLRYALSNLCFASLNKKMTPE